MGTRTLATVLLSAGLFACSDDAGTGQEVGDTDASSTTGGAGPTGGTSSVGSTSTGDGVDTGSSEGAETDDTPSGPPEGPFGGGDRLRPRVLDAGDGAQLLTAWRDTELGVECSYAHDESWTLRCLPWEGGTLSYADASCEDTVMRWSSCGEPGPYVSTGFGQACVGPIRRRQPFAVGDELTSTTLYRLDDSGDCVADDPLYDGERVYAAQPADAALFVDAAVVEYPLDEGLGVVVAEPSDGSHQRLIGSLTAPSFDEPGRHCIARELEDSTVCIPNTLTWDYGLYFGDDSCAPESRVSYNVSAPECGEASVALVFEQGECGYGFPTIHAVTGEVPSADVHQTDGETCEAASPGTVQRFWSPGAPLEAGALPTLSEVGMGRGTVRANYYASAAGTIVMPSFGFYDDGRGEECTEFATADGTRCLPRFDALQDSGYWADETCSDTPLISVPVGPCAAEAPNLVARWSEFVDACDSGRVLEIYEVGPAHDGLVYIGGADGGCVPAELGPDQGTRALGPMLPLSDFPALEHVEG